MRPAALALTVVLATAAAAPLTAQHQPPPDTTIRGLPTNEEGQPRHLPPLPAGLTLDAIRAGDSLFHGKGNCFACHGADATGLPDASAGGLDGGCGCRAARPPRAPGAAGLLVGLMLVGWLRRAQRPNKNQAPRKR